MIYGPHTFRLGHKTKEKNAGRNLQYGPRTRLEVCIDWQVTLFTDDVRAQRKAFGLVYSGYNLLKGQGGKCSFVCILVCYERMITALLENAGITTVKIS